MKVYNAIVKSANIRIEDETFVVNVSLSFQHKGVDFTSKGCSLASIHPTENYDNKYQIMSWYMSKLFEVTGITDFAQLDGRPVRAIFKNDGHCGDVCIGLQHFLYDEIFFIPRLMYETDSEQIKENKEIIENLFEGNKRNKYLSNSDYRILQNLS